ncbi:GrpB family protein [Rhizobacter sp. P5_C2]
MAVVLVPYSEEWPSGFAAVRAQLLQAFEPQRVVVEHIGSTAVPGLSAKPIVDVLLGAISLRGIEERIEVLTELGLEYVPKYEQELPMRRYFVRRAGDAPRVNLHAVVLGSTFWIEHLAFRDALRQDPSLVARYQQLKADLAGEFSHDRLSYTQAKAPFIRAVIASFRNAGPSR